MGNDNITNSTTTITKQSKQKLEVDSNVLVSPKFTNLVRPLWEAQIPYKIHIAEDHDMKEMWYEVAKLGLSIINLGSRGLGVARHGSNGRLESMNDYLHPPSHASHCGGVQKLEMLV